MLVFKDISSKHSGKYTCYASNSAATVNHTSELLVKGKHWNSVAIFLEKEMFFVNEFNVLFIVAPRWVMEPQDTALMLGQAVVINCEAEGYPHPTITWLKGGNKNGRKKCNHK